MGAEPQILAGSMWNFFFERAFRTGKAVESFVLLVHVVPSTSENRSKVLSSSFMWFFLLQKIGRTICIPHSCVFFSSGNPSKGWSSSFVWFLIRRKIGRTFCLPHSCGSFYVGKEVESCVFLIVDVLFRRGF